MNKRMIENLIFAGAFDSFGHPRAELMAVYAPFMDKIIERNKRNNSAQISLFGTLINDDDYLTIDYPGLTEYNSKYKLSKEKEVVGVYLTGHPLSDFKEQFDRFTFTTRALDYFTEDEEGERTYTEVTEGQKVHFGGIITAKDKIMTKNGSMMGFVTVEDLYGQIECTLFSRIYEEVKTFAVEDEIVEIHGRIHIKDNKVSINVEKIEKMQTSEPEVTEEKQQEYMGIILPTSISDKADDVLDVLMSYPGDIPVIMAIDGKKYSTGCSIRKCEGLLSELRVYVTDKEIIFFKKS